MIMSSSSRLWQQLLLGQGGGQLAAVTALTPILSSSSSSSRRRRRYCPTTPRYFSQQQDTEKEKKTPEEKQAIQEARKARKAEKERFKAEKKLKKQTEQLARQEAERIHPVTYNNNKNNNNKDAAVVHNVAPYGDYHLVQSQSQSGRTFTHLQDDKLKAGQQLWIRGRLQSIRVKGGSCFLVLRQNSLDTIQACYFKNNKEHQPEESQKMIRYLKSLTVESVIDLQGTLVEPASPVQSCSIQNLEVSLERVHAVSKAAAVLPFLVEDAARSQVDVEASQDTDRPFPRLGQELRLDHRWMDLRVPAHNAILRIQSAVGQLFRQALYERNFIEIHSPKLIAGESESGAGVFTTDYFGQTACLAQSPQLYKQMAMASDMDRVFEVGPVFRAENSKTRRHLCEFTGLDLEMAIEEHYDEALDVIHELFKHIFNGLEDKWARELAVIREQYESEPVTFTDEPCILHWPEAMKMLRDKFDMGDEMGDLTGAMELELGRQVKEKYGADFFMLDKYPSAIRPFYTMPDPVDKRYSNSYDIFIRGQEICSGAQRCHDPDLVEEILKEKGIEAGDGLQSYIDSFRHGVNPHAGAGIGLERVVFLYLGLDNVRKASMFPRDPNRCSP